MTLKNLRKWDWVGAFTIDMKSGRETNKREDFTSGDICQDGGRWVEIKDIKADIIKTCKELAKDPKFSGEKMTQLSTSEIFGGIKALMEYGNIKESDLEKEE